VVFAAASIVLPKRYKASFVLTIYSNYFQNPLTRDFTSELYDSTEMRAQREAVLRQSLTPEFLDALGTKYGIYGGGLRGPLQRFFKYIEDKYGLILVPTESKTRSWERKDLLSRIQILNLNSDTFQVGFVYSNPDVTFHAIQDIYTQVTHGLLEVRRSHLAAVHGAIQKRLQSLATNLPALEAPNGSAPAGNSSAQAAVPPSVDDELADVRSQLRVLRARYTEEHPLVIELREREKSLVSIGATSPESAPSAPLAVRVPQTAASEIYTDLTKKLNYLNVSLDSDQEHPGDYFAALESPMYPTGPLWPKRGLMLMWGFAIGLIGSLMLAAVLEYFDRTAFRAEGMAQRLSLPMLGELPYISNMPQV
jgi:hypothetical protein